MAKDAFIAVGNCGFCKQVHFVNSLSQINTVYCRRFSKSIEGFTKVKTSIQPGFWKVCCVFEFGNEFEARFHVERLEVR